MDISMMDGALVKRTAVLLLAALTFSVPCVAADVPFPAYGVPAPGAITTVPMPEGDHFLHLQSAIEIAVAKSPSLLQARSVVSQSRSDVLLAQTPIKPDLSGQASYTAIGGSFGSAPERTTELELSQLAFDGGRTLAQIRSAQFGLDAAGNTYHRAIQTLVFNVAQAYYATLEARSQVSLQLEIVNQDLQQEQLVAAQIRAGTAARIDLATAQIPTAQARVAVVRAQGDALAAQASFASTLGLPPDSDVVPITDLAEVERSALPEKVSLDYELAAAHAIQTRPDYLSAQRQLTSTRESVLAAQRLRAPSITIQASLGPTSGGTSGPQQWSSASQALATLSVPIFDQGIPEAETSSAQASEQQAGAQVSITRLAVLTDVRQSLVQLVAAQAALGQTGDELTKARQVLDATQLQYKAGQTTLSLLLNAQSQRAGAETDFLTAQYALRVAEQTYLYALGVNDAQIGMR